VLSWDSWHLCYNLNDSYLLTNEIYLPSGWSAKIVAVLCYYKVVNLTAINLGNALSLTDKNMYLYTIGRFMI